MRTMIKRKPQLDLTSLMGAIQGGQIAGCFARMEVAEEVLEDEGLKRHPTAFMLARPVDGLLDRTVDLRVYRAHVVELCRRIKFGEDTRPGTEAEVLLGLSAMSLKAPPAQEVGLLFERLFKNVMGYLPDGEFYGREQWRGQLDELLAEARRTCRQEWRHAP